MGVTQVIISEKNLYRLPADGLKIIFHHTLQTGAAPLARNDDASDSV
jgi:hypothetical protein